MSLRLPGSLVKEYGLVFSGDPALTLPEDAEQQANALRVARETGNWTPLVTGGEEPTIFYVRPLAGRLFTWWSSEVRFSAVCGRPLDEHEAADLAFRLALRRVTNLGSIKVQHVQQGGQQLASTDVLDAVLNLRPDAPGFGRGVVLELAALIVERALQGVPPL